MATAIDIILRALGAAQVKSDLKGVADAAGAVGNAATAAGDKSKNAFAGREAGAKRSADALKTAKAETENLSQSLGNARNWGAGLALAGAGGVLLSNSLIEVYQSGARAEAKMDALFTKRGEGGRVEELSKWASDLSMQAALVDDDPIKEAAAGLAGFGVNADQVKAIMPGLIGQSRLYNQSLDSVSEAFGRAFAKGDAAGLRRSGVTISQADEDRIKAITDEGERQKAVFEVVKTSMDQYALSITEGMSESEIAANRFKNEMDSMQTAIGKGSADAQASINGMALGVVALVSHNPDVAYAAGQFLTWGSNALAAGGSLLAMGAQFAQVLLYMNAMKVARAANAVSAAADAAATAGEGIAITATGGAAVIAAGEMEALAAAETTAAATGMAAFLPVLATIGSIAAVALIAAAAMYALDKALHWKEDRELEASIKSGDAARVKLLEIENKKRAKKGLPALTAEEFQPDPNADDKVNNMPDMAALQAQLAKAMNPTAAGIPAAAAVPVAATAIAAIAPTAAARAADAAQKKIDAQAARDAGLDARGTGSEISEAARAKTDDLKAALADQKEDAKDALDAQIDAVKAQIKAHSIGKDAGAAQIEALQAAFEHRQSALEHSNQVMIDNIEAQAVLSEAEATAAAQTGTQAEETMRVANAKIKKIMHDADREFARATRARSKIEDVAALENVGQKMFADFAKVTGFGAGRGGSAGRGGMLRVGNPKYSQSPKGTHIFQFPPIEVPMSGVDGALGAY